MEKCKVLTNWTDKNMGIVHYDPCNGNVKYSITYKDGARGKMITRNVCGIHKRSFEMNCARVNKQIGYNYCQFSFKPIVGEKILNSKNTH